MLTTLFTNSLIFSPPQEHPPQQQQYVLPRCPRRLLLLPDPPPRPLIIPTSDRGLLRLLLQAEALLLLRPGAGGEPASGGEAQREGRGGWVGFGLNTFVLSSWVLGLLLAPSPHGPFFWGEGTLEASLRPGGGV